jgi:cellulase/cellobiase CelA1
VNGLSSTVGLMTTAAGRNTVGYLVRCALPAGASLIKKDQYGVSYTFPGALGFAPEWQTSACGPVCQEYVSACMMAHINTTGSKVPVWLVAHKANVGWGLNADYPNQEGTFFGNIFMTGAHGGDPNRVQAFYCHGKAYDKNVVPGRIGANQTNAPYVNPFSTYGTGYCQDACTPSDYPNVDSGYKACNGWNYAVTTYRKAETAATGGVVTATAAAPTAPLTATITKYSETSSGYCANVSVKNSGATTVPTWTVVYDTGSARQWYHWFASVSMVGSIHTAKGTTAINQIVPGGTRTFGFCAKYFGGTANPVIKSVSAQ